MKTYTTTVNEGEWFEEGTVEDWLAEHASNSTTSLGQGVGVPALSEEQIAMVRTLATAPPEGQFYAVLCSYSDMWRRVYCVGLYDGWVFWRKRLCVSTAGPLGAETGEAYTLQAVRLAKRCGCEGGCGGLCRGFRLVATS